MAKAMRADVKEDVGPMHDNVSSATGSERSAGDATTNSLCSICREYGSSKPFLSQYDRSHLASARRHLGSIAPLLKCFPISRQT
jgi:hypothetical protein